MEDIRVLETHIAKVNMKTIAKYSGCYTIVIALSLVAIFGCSCNRSGSGTDPLAGWKVDFKEQPNQAISKDYEAYIKSLPPEERKFAVAGQFFEDGTGQHALVVEVALDGTDWSHVLFYDKQNKRVRVIKYVSGRYRS